MGNERYPPTRHDRAIIWPDTDHASHARVVARYFLANRSRFGTGLSAIRSASPCLPGNYTRPARASHGLGRNQEARRHEVPQLRVSVPPWFTRRLFYTTAPATALDSSPFFESFSSVTSTSVVSAKPMALAAFSSAVRATLVGSMMPALNISTYSPVAAL